MLSIASHPGIFPANLLLIIRDLYGCLQPCVISSTTFSEKLDFTTANHIKEYINLLCRDVSRGYLGIVVFIGRVTKHEVGSISSHFEIAIA